MLRKKKNQTVTVKHSHIIPRDQHCISKTDISPNALKVLNRLNGDGFEAYLVGGSVRDLLLHKAPKDFDVATNATPSQIRKLFRNARIIGRRFKLVHILFYKEIIEVATFRAQSEDAESEQEENHQTNEQGMLVRDNVFGSLEDDAWRRDFTINSMYYRVTDSAIIDFTGGKADCDNKLIRIIGEPTNRYKEDPVRMIRAIRFSAKLHFNIEKETSEAIHKNAALINNVSSSRLFDEMTKLYQCGEAETTHRLLLEYGLFAQLFPQTAALQNSDYPSNAFIGIALENTDRRIQQDKPVTPAFLMSVLLWFPLMEKTQMLQEEGHPPLPALEQAMSIVISEQNQTVFIPKRFSQVMREIWLLQYRFNKRFGKRPYSLLHHPRFRAAYDFMALRALAGDEDMELANWWTEFQDKDEEGQQSMINALNQKDPARKKRRRRAPRRAPDES